MKKFLALLTYFVTTMFYWLTLQTLALSCSGTAGSILWKQICNYGDTMAWELLIIDGLMVAGLYYLAFIRQQRFGGVAFYQYLFFARAFFLVFLWYAPREYSP
jgi:hypothetical protein